jgi:hypothetical protein
MPAMKLASFAFATTAVALLGCQNESTKLDNPSAKGDHAAIAMPPPSGDLEARVRKLEMDNAKYAEALDFLQKVYSQQKQQETAEKERREREEPAPDATFAVDVAPDIKAGQVEGPATACVTLVEAWDFA